MTGATLDRAVLVGVKLQNAILKNCKVYGIAAWDLEGIPENQTGLIITPNDQAVLTVDDLQLAQLIYLLLDNKKISNVIDSMTAKAVLILGRFTNDRKPILDAMADEIRKYNLLPIIFDFERSPSRDFTETVKILAGMSLFIIADITNPRSAPLELQAIIPDYQVPIIPILQEGEKPFAMFSDLVKYNWVLDPVEYRSKEHLLSGFKAAILDEGWKKHQELQLKKAATVKAKSIDDFKDESI